MASHAVLRGVKSPLPMPVEQIQAKILTIVATRFADLKQATPRKGLILQFRDSEAIADLLNRNVLRRKESAPEEYLPTAAAFEFCDDLHLRDRAKLATTVVLHALQNIYRVENKPDLYTFEELLEHVERIYPGRMFDEETLKLGLYLARDFGVLGGHRLNHPDNTEVISFQVGERIITMGDLDNAWDVVTSAFKPTPRAPAVQAHAHEEVGLVAFGLSAPPVPPAQPPAQAIKKTTKPKPKDQVFLPARSQHAAYLQLRKIVKLARQQILIIDPYVDHTLWDLLTNLKPKVNIRILTNQMKGDFRLEGRKFIDQHGYKVEIRTTSKYHDRFIIEDCRRCWHIGASIKDAGDRAFALSELSRSEVVKFVISDAEEQWSAATEIAL